MLQGTGSGFSAAVIKKWLKYKIRLSGCFPTYYVLLNVKMYLDWRFLLNVKDKWVLQFPWFKGAGWKLNPSSKSRPGTSFSSFVYVLVHTVPEGMIWGFCWCGWSAAALLGGLIQCWVYRAANELCWGKAFPAAASPPAFGLLWYYSCWVFQ